jgi:thiol-disulfide isomerase/thioredoxin
VNNELNYLTLKFLLSKKILTLILLAILAGCSVADKNNGFKSKLRLVDLEGRPVENAIPDDKYILINFWATWCKPCLREMPALQELQRSLKDENIEFLFVSNEEPGHVSEFLKNRALNIDSYIMRDAVETFELMYLPTTYIISPEGDVLLKEEGERDWASSGMIRKVKELM